MVEPCYNERLRDWQIIMMAMMRFCHIIILICFFPYILLFLGLGVLLVMLCIV